MHFQDLFIHVYWRPALFWGLAIVLAVIDIAVTWRLGRAVRISGRPLLSVSRRIYINAAILGSFPVLSVLRFYDHGQLALAWFLGSQLAIGLISVRPMLGRLIEVRRSSVSGARRAIGPRAVAHHG
ncbi:MAG: hypothetical protein ACYCV6_02715 [Steroidobacteraceae bacterium]